MASPSGLLCCGSAVFAVRKGSAFPNELTPKFFRGSASSRRGAASPERWCIDRDGKAKPFRTSGRRSRFISRRTQPKMFHSAWAEQLGATRFAVETGAGCSLALKAQHKTAQGLSRHIGVPWVGGSPSDQSPESLSRSKISNCRVRLARPPDFVSNVSFRLLLQVPQTWYPNR